MTHALSITVGVYVLYFLRTILVFPIWTSFALAFIAVIGISLILYYVLYKPLKEKEVQNWVLMIASLGVYVVFINGLSILFGNQILSLGVPEKGLSFFRDLFFLTNIQCVTFLGCILLLLVTYFVSECTAVGKRMKALSSNPGASVAFGIDKDRTTAWCFIIGSALAFFAGVFICLDVSIKPTIGFDWLFPGVVAMIIGGMGKMRHLVFGALLLAAAQHLSAYFFDSKWMNATAYIILVVFLYFRPYGFSGKKLKKTEI